MKAKVIENLCIGCGACQSITSSEEFEINDAGFAEAVNDIVKKENEDVVVEAKDNCPTGAIVVSE